MMNRLNSTQRKLVYVGGIFLMIPLIIWLGMPGQKGHISQLREEYDLGESTLGDVDPASSTMNLVLLGLRGIAADLLWMDAIHQKETKNWSQLESTVNSIILLQPHYLTVWKFQGWNLAYNVSAELDAVEDRYYWVKRGAKFMQRGTRRNQDAPELYHDLGDFLGKKMGRSDEWEQFRKFFLSDPDEQYAGGPDEELNPEGKDNYLVAKDYYIVANEKEELEGVEQHKMARPLFRQYPWRSQLDYADALQREGDFGEVTREAWERAYREWTEIYGREPFQTPGGEILLEPTEQDIIELAEKDDVSIELKKHWTDRYQNMVNYRYWRLRAEVEAGREMAEARRDLYEGKRLFIDDQDLLAAREKLESGLHKMQAVFDKYQLGESEAEVQGELRREDQLVEDILKSLIMWRYILAIYNEPVPEEYPMDIVWNENPDRRAELDQLFQSLYGSN